MMCNPHDAGARSNMPTARLLDVAIIGGGIGGVVHLHYARCAGLDAMVFEAQEGVGGLWRQLPAWQDIQIGTADWALGDIPLAGPFQPQVLSNIEAWVTHFGLADGIQLKTPVLQARPVEDGCWELSTPAGTFRARHLVAASGAHNKPMVPTIERSATRVRELHSSELRDPAELAGRSVLVVGAGASALDLLDQCLEHGARRIAWAYRGLRWFTPTRKPKAIAGTVRSYARMQTSGMTAAQQNAAIEADMRSRYEKFGITDILPARPLDVLHDQLIPGRARMLENFAALERYPGNVAAIDGSTVVMADGQRLDDIDVLLWGTGYATDLPYIDVPSLAAIRSLKELGARCGGGFRSLDAANLYFPGVGLDGIGSAPWASCLMARTIMSHIRGTARLDMAPVPHRLNHFDLVTYLAPRDPGSFVPGEWEEQFRKLAMETGDEVAYPMP
jgi:hypothetical protein